jgi:hypothetical protein
MSKRTTYIAVIFIVILFIIGRWYYNNSYVLLKPILTKPTGEPIFVPYTNEMIRNFPDVLKHFGVAYKMNDSGHFMIKAAHMNEVDYILTMTEYMIDSSQMKVIRAGIKSK